MAENKGANRPSYSCDFSRNTPSCLTSTNVHEIRIVAAHVQCFNFPAQAQGMRFAAMTFRSGTNHTIRGAKEVPGLGRLDIEITSIPRTQSRRHLPVLSILTGPLIRKSASLFSFNIQSQFINDTVL